MTAVAIDALNLRRRALKLKAAQQQADPEAEPWYEDLGEGVYSSGLDTYYGTKELFTDLTDEEKANVEDWRADAAESGWGTAGRVIGEIGQLALPGAAATKGLRAVAAAAKLAKAGKAAKAAKIGIPIAGDVIAAAGHGALKLPQEGESRLQGAVESTAGALAGAGIGGVLKKAVKGLKIKPKAQALMDEGVYLTPGQAAESKAVKALESVLDITPLLARGTQEAQEKAGKSFALHAINKAAPKGVQITKIGTEGFTQLNKAVDDAYTKAWSKVDEIPPAAAENMLKHIDDVSTALPVDDARVLSKVTDDVIKLLDEGDTSDVAKTFDNVLRKKIKAAVRGDKSELKSELQQLRRMFRESISPDAAKALAEIDAQYPAYLTIRKATKNANLTDGVFTPAQLSNAGKTVAKETLTASGKSPLYKTASQGIETAGDTAKGGEIIGRMRRFMSFMGAPVPMQGAGELALGQGKYVQKALQRGIASPTAAALRDYISPARLGAAYEE